MSVGMHKELLFRQITHVNDIPKRKINAIMIMVITKSVVMFEFLLVS